MGEKTRKQLNRELLRARVVSKFFLFFVTTLTLVFVISILMVSQGQSVTGRQLFIMLGIVIWTSLIGATVSGLRHRDLSREAALQQELEEIELRLAKLEEVTSVTPPEEPSSENDS